MLSIKEMHQIKRLILIDLSDCS